MNNNCVIFGGEYRTISYFWPYSHLIASSSEEARHRVRQSLAVFLHPDADTLIECLDGSKKYTPITAGEFQKKKIDATVY